MNRETRNYNLGFTNDQKMLDSKFKSQYDTFREVLQDLKDHNIIKKPLGNKEEHKIIAERRFRNTKIPRLFCFHCESFQDNVHYCKGRGLWQNIDPVNNLLIVGTTRKNVERNPEHFWTKFLKHNVDDEKYNWYKHYRNKADMLTDLEYEARKRKMKKEEEERIRREEEEELRREQELGSDEEEEYQRWMQDLRMNHLMLKR